MTRRRYWTALTAIPYAVTVVMLNATIGILRLWESPNRTASPAYSSAKLLPFPIKAWGVLFIAVALLVAISSNRRWALLAGCVLGAGVWGFWAGLLFASAYDTGRSSYVGVILYAAGAARHLQVVAAPNVIRQAGQRLWRRIGPRLRRLRPCSG